MAIARTLALLAGLAAGSVALAAPPAARADQAGPVQVGSSSLVAHSGGDCSTGATSGTAIGGAAVIIATVDVPKPRLIGVLILQGLTPNHTYGVGLVQTPSGDGCLVAERRVTTNAKGNAILEMQEGLEPSTTGAFFTVLPNPSKAINVIASTPTFAISRLQPAAPVAPSTVKFGKH
jgi:hypothetical protein